ncbi:helix-turn-helix domain-containing protein [Leptospira sarikeiensis]|uniref:helix-turn-helix domain-containing protein n=1 Tax=Leptospira sarikeiensis TaxID=2484943 RepID=UPI001FE73BB6|nr:helix-turn-helix domain-containing protein [Leptospira sarikeiensis]
MLKSDLHGLGALFITLTICFLYFFSQRFPILFSPDPNGKQKKSRLQSLDIARLKQRIEKLLEEEKIYRTEELSISVFASSLNEEGEKITPEQISEFVNTTYEKNFNQFINEYRIKEACELLISNPNLSVLTVALSVGFNSKSSFHPAFKSFTGMSPTEYREKNPKNRF